MILTVQLKNKNEDGDYEKPAGRRPCMGHGR
jgi:hypothetical protein